MSIAAPGGDSEPVHSTPGCPYWGAGSAPRNPLYATEKSLPLSLSRDRIVSDLTPLLRRIGTKLRRSLRRRAANQPYPAGLLALGSSPVPRLPIQMDSGYSGAATRLQWRLRSGFSPLSLFALGFPAHQVGLA